MKTKHKFDADFLRENVKSRMNEKRYLHTLGVEREAAFLAGLYMPEREDELRCAALLHDITKNDSSEKQLQYCAEFGIMVCNSDMESPKLFHAKTAAAVIGRDFPEYSTDDIVGAVRWHTTGRYGMTLFESIIYLADYIEDTRTFDDCVRLRNYFRDALPWEMTESDRMCHLYRTMVFSVELTLGCLISEGAFIDTDTVGCRNYFLHLLRSSDKIPESQKGMV